jgi:hypothetical protein
MASDLVVPGGGEDYQPSSGMGSSAPAIAPPDPQPQPKPVPQTNPPPDPAPTPRANPYDAVVDQVAPPPATGASRYDDAAAQVAGAQRALVASAVHAGVQQDPDRAAKVLAIAQQLNLPPSAVEANYEQLSARARFDQVDYPRLLAQHPELAGWMANRDNAAVAHDDVPALRQVDLALRSLTNPHDDVTGILPSGYTFDPHGGIVGPVAGGLATTYAGLEDLRAELKRRDDVASVIDLDQQASAQQLRDRYGFDLLGEHIDAPANIAAGFMSSAGGTVSTLKRIFGLPVDRETSAIQDVTAASTTLSPGIVGDIQRGMGGLAADAPLLFVGGPIADAAGALLKTRAAATLLPGVAKSGYLLDAFKVAAAMQPIALKSGINTGAEHGVGYGLIDYVINSAVPAAFGRTGLAHAIVPGEEAAAADGWLGASKRLLLDAGFQATNNATTELANAIHDYASGVDPDALKPERLAQRLGAAGAMGAIAGTAFNALPAFRDKIERDRIAANQALSFADRLGVAVEAAKGSKLGERAPEQLKQLLTELVGEKAGSTVYYQGSEWDTAWRAAGEDPAKVAEDMGVGEAYRQAQRSGSAMGVPAGELVARAARLDDPKALLMGAREIPGASSAHEAMVFHQESLEDLQGLQRVMEEQARGAEAAGKAADASKAQPDQIYEDVLAQLVGAGTETKAAEQQAKLTSAFFGTMAKRLSTGQEWQVDPSALYDRYQLTINRGVPEALKRAQGDLPDGTGDSLNNLLNRLRKGEQPKDPQQSADFQQMRAYLDRLGVNLKKADNAAARAIIEKDQAAAPPAEGVTFDQRLEVPGDYLRHEYLLKQWKKAHGDRSPTPGDKDWQKLVHQADMVDAALGRTYEQPKRGQIEISPSRRVTITLFEGRDLSTFLHESGHFYLEVLGDVAARRDANEGIRQDYQKILDWLGVKDRNGITVKEHEQFARGFESYLMEGKAPSNALRGAFDRFRAWLLYLYKSIKSLAVKLTPEVRDVFDRMLASDQEIADARDRLGIKQQYFENRDQAGMTEEEWSRYQANVEKQTIAERDALGQKVMAVVRREQTKLWKEELGQVTEEVRGRVEQTPPYAAARTLGLEGAIKLDREHILRNYGKEGLAQLPRDVHAGEGKVVKLEEAAGLFGFRSGDELMRALSNLKPMEDVVAAESEAVMRERHPDIMLDGTMAEEAMTAVHNEIRSEVLNAEALKLAVKAGRRPAPLERIRELARRQIEQLPTRDIAPALYLRGERSAGRASFEALRKGDYNAALEAKQRELMLQELYRAATEAKETIGDAVKFARQALKPAAQEAFGKADGAEYVVTLAGGETKVFGNELDAQEFARSSGGQVERGAGFRERISSMASELLRGYRSMGYADLVGAYDQLRATAHQARESLQLSEIAAGEQVTEAVAKLAKQAAESHPELRKRTASPGRIVEPALRFLENADALHTKLSFMARRMDGEKDGGIFWKLFVKPLNDASDSEVERRHQAALALEQIFSTWGKGRFGKPSIYARKHLAAINDDISHIGRIMVALNWGAAANRERIVTGHGWTDEQVQSILDTLDEADWKLVTSVWDHIGSYWPEISAQQRRLTGLEPQKREELPIQTRFGLVKGKYFPIKYDPTASARALQDDLSTDARGRSARNPSTRAGFTKATVETTGRRLRLDEGVIFQHLNEVIHRLSHEDKLADIRKLLNDRRLQSSIVDRYGIDAYRIVRDTVADVAVGDVPAQGSIEKALRHLRTGATAAAMGFNLMSAAMNLTGISQSIERLGPQWIGVGMSRMMRDATSMESTAKWVTQKSKMMAGRARTLNREVADTLNTIGSKGVSTGIRRHLYDFMHKGQMLVDLPTWVGAYEKFLAETPGDEARAVALADQLVIDTQGSGAMKDLAKIQRGNEYLKLFTSFYGYFNTTYNLSRSAIAGASLTPPASAASRSRSCCCTRRRSS